MKWVFVVLLFFIVGCSQNAEEEEVAEAARVMPPNILVDNYTTYRTSSCWDGENKPCIETKDIQEGLEQRRADPFDIASNASLAINISPTEYDIEFPAPNQTTILLDGTEEVLTFTGYTGSMNAPSEPGTYYYEAEATWDNEEIRGKSIYLFALRVR
ncbi:hypothetical protein FLK61_24375 [Paenalkalicoccus suaedae]|uniref:Lipoprotein n=1 Tax=Paenalkalicoccus suaedae TaxID=2592382 RepID=A0A859FB86_9BACI|nr:hypothetical protein [Paenalkalicoccus suaedae]QKS69921.1 hypothetical protein FLK61_24375 [Paenalkalicoccus suaedae]